MPTFRFLKSYLGLALLAFALSFPSAARAANPTIALISDYGWEDPYVSQLKGVILSANANARIVDLMHTVSPFNIAEGAYLLDQAAADFPQGTIFVAVIDPQSSTVRDPIILQTKKGKFYVGPDNGIFTYVIDREGYAEAWKLDKPQYYRAPDKPTSLNSRGRDIYGPIAARLASGMTPDRLGTTVSGKTITMLPIKDPTIAGGIVSVQVLHVDRYGNVILNLPSDSPVAAKFQEGNLVKISVGKESHSGPLVKNYADIEKGRLILLYGGNGLLQIAVNQGSAEKQLKIEPGDVIFLKP